MKFKGIASILVVFLFSIAAILFTYMLTSKVEALNDQIAILQQNISDQKMFIEQQAITTGKGIYALTVQIQEIQQKLDEATVILQEKSSPEPDVPDRGGGRGISPVTMRVTAYDLSYASCRKYPDDPEYGITASGMKVKEWYTVAAGPDVPFGTRVFIPYFKDMPNGGIFTVQDRGSSIKNNCLDVYIPDYDDCMDFGVQELEVYFLE